MPKRRSDATCRRFLDQYEKVRVPRFRAMGIIDPSRYYALIPFVVRTKLLSVAHVRFPNGGGWSFFVCPGCSRRTTNLYLIDEAPRCGRCCGARNIHHRSRYGFGREERLRERDKHLDCMQAQLDATTPLRFNPAPKHWRGRSRIVSNSRALAMRMRRSMVVCRLNQLASLQAAKQGDDGLLCAYQPRAEAARTIDIKPIWRARTSEALQQALDDAQSALFAALSSNDPQQRLAAARLFMRTRQARERGW
jgi:hypothetical protein